MPPARTVSMVKVKRTTFYARQH